MVKFLKDSREVFKGNWRNVIMASMMFYIILFACMMLTVKLPVHILIKVVIGLVLFTFVIIPLVHGYIRFFINLVNGKEMEINPYQVLKQLKIIDLIHAQTPLTIKPELRK
jgi:antibiotic biosynthesis monooxygenase (ABM) superfamily enzyme